MNDKTHTICLIGGDGIGPEVIAATRQLLDSTGIVFSFVEAAAGYKQYQKTGKSLPEETIEKARKSDAILFGAVTTPPGIENYKSPIIQLRNLLSLYANLRPIVSLPIQSFRQNLDFYIVRENTEDLYVGQEEAIEGGFMAKRIITKKASERIIRFAFNLARKKKKQLVTVVHKANVLRKTDGLFLNVAQTVAQEFQDIQMEDMLVDATAMRLIKEPEHFQVLVTTNMFGDILSDEASMLVGGLGVAASANIGEHLALFEPVHGSAPKYVGQNQANPTACFFASIMMLEYLGELEAANRIKKAIIATITNKVMTKDLGGTASSSEFTQSVIAQLESI